MKANSGVTTTSLIIYIIAMMIVIGIVATITSFFYTNINNLDENSKNISEITKFNVYFIEEIEKEDNSVILIQDNKKSISFSSGNTYTFQDNAIYLNTIRICDNISNMQIEMQEKEGKTILTVLITTGNKMEYTKVTQYVIKSM